MSSIAPLGKYDRFKVFLVYIQITVTNKKIHKVNFTIINYIQKTVTLTLT